LDEQALGPRFEIEKAHGAQGHPPARIKTEEETLLRCLTVQFMLKNPKHIGRNMLKLGFPFITDPTSSHNLISLFPFDGVKHQSPFCRKRMMGSGGYLRPGQPFVIPGDDVACVRNIESRLIVAPGNVPRGSDFEKFGVERPSI